MVWLIKVNFWGHIVKRSELGSQVTVSISAVNWCGKTEVSNLKGEVLVKQKIFWLKISVSNTLLVAILESLNELLEEISGKWLVKSS